MTQVEIYTTPFCGFCARAKSFLERKAVAYTEIDVMATPGKRDEMVERAAGRTSVPQIFIDDRHIGGCDDLFELDLDDEFDPLLGLTG